MLLGYGHRTVDGRIAWGGLGAPYTWNSAIPASPMRNERILSRLRSSLVSLFPVLDGIELTHHWGGVMGVPRDLQPGIGFDRAAGFAWAGGYTGQGVATANAAGRGLADVIVAIDSPLVGLPWVGHRSRPWEREPLRWLGVHAATTAGRLTDERDAFRGRRKASRPD